MVINADLHQAALSGQDDETVKYVQSISSLFQVPIFQITAVLISKTLPYFIIMRWFWSSRLTCVGMRSLLKGLGPWRCKVLQAALGRAFLCLPDMWSRSSTVLPLLCACFGNRRGKDPRLARQPHPWIWKREKKKDSDLQIHFITLSSMISDLLAPNKINFLLSVLIDLIWHILVKVRKCNSKKFDVIQHYCYISIGFN